ncbi:hypothetical protein VTN96DRAFT_1803 [Rasamsonia emersonii]
MDQNPFADFVSLPKVHKAFEEHLPVRFLVEIPTKYLPSKDDIEDTWLAVRPVVITTLYGAGLGEVLTREKEAAGAFEKLVENEANENDDENTDNGNRKADGEEARGSNQESSHQPNFQKPPRTTIRVAWMEILEPNSYIIVEINYPGYDVSTADEHDAPILPVFVMRLRQPKKATSEEEQGDSEDEGPYFSIQNIHPGWALRVAKRCVKVHRHFQKLLDMAIENGQDEASLNRLRPPYIVNNTAFRR